MDIEVEEDQFECEELSQLLHAPPSPGKGRRASLGSTRRLSSSLRPESHPVSPVSSGGGSGSPPAGSPPLLWKQSSRPGSIPASPATSQLSLFTTIPAYRGSAPPEWGNTAAGSSAAGSATVDGEAALRAASVAAVVEERITLNIFVHDGPTGEDVQQLQEEMEGLRRRMGLLQSRLGEAQQGAVPPSAAQGPEVVQLVIHVAEAAHEPATAAPPEPEPVVLVLNIVEAPTAPPSAAAPPEEAAQLAGMAAQLQRVEACREELARQAGQLRGRVAKVRVVVAAT